MSAYHTAMAIWLVITTAVGIWGHPHFFLIFIVAGLATAGLHEIIGDCEKN